MIKYAIPGMYEFSELNFRFLDLKRNHPEYFYDNIDIEISYGNPQFCIWDGGRVFNNYYQGTKEEIKNIINIYNNDFKIPIRYVFTNTCLEEKHYHNRFGNLLMEWGSEGNNEVVLNDENFLLYLKNTYPTYKFVSSTTKCITKHSEVKQELNKDNYKLVCLDYNLNFQLEFLKTFNEKEKNKTEFLVNPICGLGCPHRKHHYYLNSQAHLRYGKPYSLEGCYIKDLGVSPTTKSHHLKYEDIKNHYEPLGFSHYKIEGRTWDEISVILTYCNYMVKPEYKDLVIMTILK